MNVRVEVVCTGFDGTEQRRHVMTIQRAELVMETLGMNLTEGKALLAGVQDLLLRTKSTNIWSNIGNARPAVNGIRTRIPGARL